MNENISIQISSELSNKLNSISSKTGKAIDEIISESLCSAIEKTNLNIPLKDVSVEYYQNKKEINVITELELRQINIARDIITNDSGVYGQSLKRGRYINDRYSKWQVFDVDKTELGITRYVLWNESDDGSYSVHFSEDNQPVFYCYEN